MSFSVTLIAIKKAHNRRQDCALVEDGANGMAYADPDHDDGV